MSGTESASQWPSVVFQTLNLKNSFGVTGDFLQHEVVSKWLYSFSRCCLFIIDVFGEHASLCTLQLYSFSVHAVSILEIGCVIHAWNSKKVVRAVHSSYCIRFTFSGSNSSSQSSLLPALRVNLSCSRVLWQLFFDSAWTVLFSFFILQTVHVSFILYKYV